MPDALSVGGVNEFAFRSLDRGDSRSCADGWPNRTWRAGGTTTPHPRRSRRISVRRWTADSPGAPARHLHETGMGADGRRAARIGVGHELDIAAVGLHFP